MVAQESRQLRKLIGVNLAGGVPASAEPNQGSRALALFARPCNSVRSHGLLELLPVEVGFGEAAVPFTGQRPKPVAVGIAWWGTDDGPVETGGQARSEVRRLLPQDRHDGLGGTKSRLEFVLGSQGRLDAS